MQCFLPTGDFGGYMGLLLGASAMTVFELVDLFVYNCCEKIYKKVSSRAKISPKHNPEETEVYKIQMEDLEEGKLDQTA